jgi:hypothetical protein
LKSRKIEKDGHFQEAAAIMAIVKAKARCPTRSAMESHPAVSSFPRKWESKSSAKAWLDARFRGHDR